MNCFTCRHLNKKKELHKYGNDCVEIKELLVCGENKKEFADKAECSLNDEYFSCFEYDEVEKNAE
jgi:hypothetical protein